MALLHTAPGTHARSPRRLRILLASIAFQMTVALLLCVPSTANAAALPDTPDRTVVTDGDVHAIVRAGDTLYLGGLFTRVGPRTGPGVEVGLDGIRHPDVPEVSGAGPSLVPGTGAGLRAVVADGAGGWYIGGCFNHVGAIARTNLAHILADHTIDPGFAPQIDGVVDALVVSGSTIYVAGSFSNVDGQTRNNIAAVDAASGGVKAFNPNADGDVLALAVSGDGATVYAGGSGFSTIGGLPRASLAALDATTGNATTTFDPSPSGFSGGIALINALTISGSTLYVGGTFVEIAGVARASIAALSLGGASDGAAVAGFDPSPSYFGCSFCASIAALAISGSTLYAGGSFDTIGGQARGNLAGLDAIAGMATAFDPAPNANILSLTASGSTVYVGGGFTQIGGQARTYSAALDAASGNASAFDPESNGTVAAIGVSGTAVYLGGQFSSLGGVARDGLAAVSAIDGTVTTWDPAAQGSNGGSASINALALSDSILYVGGYFTAIGGAERSNVAALTIADGLATAWAPESDGVVQTMAVFAGIVYVGGSFIHIGSGGDQRIFLAAVNATDGSATDWNPNPDSTVSALVVSGDVVYVGGNFLDIGSDSQVRACIAAINVSDGNATDWNPNAGPNCGVLALSLAGSTLYAGGNFTSMHGAPRNNIAEINLADGSVTSFNPNASDGSVEALALDGSTLYAGGRFATIGGQPRGLLAALNTSDGSATDFNPNAAGTVVSALTLSSDGSLAVGGLFSTFDLAYQQAFAVFTPQVPNDRIFRDGFESP